jgi:hypothetical protein
MKDGNVESDECKDLAAVLMDIGALDQLDSQGAECIICTEDKGKVALQKCIENLGVSERVKVISYNGINNAASSVAIKAMCDLYAQKPALIIHRDRDFLIQEEITQWGIDYTNRGMTIFCPDLSDIECYQCSPEHVAKVYQITAAEAKVIVDELLANFDEEWRKKFRLKRQEANQKFWKDGGSPNTNTLWPEHEPVSIERVYGKSLLAKINERMSDFPGGRRNLGNVASDQLADLLRNAIINAGVAIPAT